MITSSLLIYKDSYRLFHKILDIQHNLPKDIKYSLGSNIINEVTDLMKCIELANKNSDKLNLRIENIVDCQSHMNLIILFERICFERAAISYKENSEFTKLAMSINNELKGWLITTKRQELNLLRLI